ncbi:hypothetical protein KV557_21780 [Kitasatospora aureofaciens]|uniref:hypothetical protein n=1 Tax=Kitasatospora aureofaciens TaxID=1894 RepID=UPI001C45A847|nr:hypothetical protein [Kitasatospora aureofaciens]MBV6699696.1 hypothetical protein [Kitasatospora aureofaciens]
MGLNNGVVAVDALSGSTPPHRWLHVAWAGRTTVDRGSPEALRAVRRTVGRMLGIAQQDVPLGRDPLGRPRLDGWPLGLAACFDSGRLTVALAREMTVALSLQEILRCWSSADLLAFTPTESTWVTEAPGRLAGERLARLWTRKEAALRLGAGPLAGASETEVLADGRDGKVALPVPLAPSHWAPAGLPAVAYVRDLTARPGFAAAVATSERIDGVRTWHWDDIEDGRP